MSMMESSQEPRKRGKSFFRMVAVGSAALFLLSTAYQASWGHVTPGYPHNHPDPDNDDDDGLSGGEIAAISVGGLAVAYGAYTFLGRKDDEEEEIEDKAVAARLASPSTKVSDVRLVPQKKEVGTGERLTLDLQVRTAGDGAWHSVTRQNGASIDVRGGSPLVRLDGAKNAFGVPITAARAGSKNVVVVGSFARPGAAPLVAQTTVRVATP